MEMSNENKKENELLILKTKAETYHKENVPVHITFLKDGEWENGYIVSSPTADFFKLEYLEAGKNKHGRAGDFMFFLQIKDIEEYSGVRK